MLGKVPGDDWQKAATLRAIYGYMSHPTEADVHGMRSARRDGTTTQLDWHLLESCTPG